MGSALRDLPAFVAVVSWVVFTLRVFVVSSSASGSEKFGAAISTITGLLYGYVAANKLLVGILGEKKVAELASAGSSLKAAAAEISAAFASGVLTGA